MSLQTAPAARSTGRDQATHPSFSSPWRSARQSIAVFFGCAGLVLVGASAAMPWLTLFHGFTPLRGFRLDGGDLSGIAVAAALLMLVAARHGGARFLRPAAAALALILTLGAVNSWRSIAAYVAEPGPAATLTAPTGSPGPLVMAAGGVALLVAALTLPLPARPLTTGVRLPLVLAVLSFVAAWMHLVLTPEHFAESAVLGSGFLLSAIAQLIIAALAIQRPSERVWSLLIIVNTALIVVWAYAVFHGLPFGGDEHAPQAGGLAIGSGEPVDPAAALTKGAELAGIAVALVLMRRTAPMGTPQS